MRPLSPRKAWKNRRRRKRKKKRPNPRRTLEALASLIHLSNFIVMNRYSSVTLSILLSASASVRSAELGGFMSADTEWTAAGSPHVITSTVTVLKGVTLKIAPGAAIQIKAGADLVVTNGGRLLAEGTAEQRIRFGRPPGVRKRWGGIVLMGGSDSPECRIRYAHIEGNDFTAVFSQHATVWLDNLTFGSRDRQYVSLDGSSFVVSRCHFQGTTGEFEPVHGSGGVKPGGHAIFRENFFGQSDGYSDIVDFTGSNRDKDQPIIEFYNNVFAGSTDDLIDLDGTDAWIEGNIFLHSHKNGAPDTSSAISGGENRNDTSEATIVGNLFYDCDQAATAKEGNFYVMLNNTMVRMTRQGGVDTDDGVLCVQDRDPRPTTYGKGFYLEGNIIVDAANLVRNNQPTEAPVVFTNNILPRAWDGAGGGNLVVDPKLKHIPALAETKFTNWQGAQIVREWFSLQPGSAAIGKGPNGRDLGGVVPVGVSVAGEPMGETTATSATLTVGFNRQSGNIPSRPWPTGAGYSHYKWRLDGGPWSEETPIAKPIQLSSLTHGQHHVEVVGRRDSGRWQDDPRLGDSATITRSRTWTVK
jgi:hypothetical protein